MTQSLRRWISFSRNGSTCMANSYPCFGTKSFPPRTPHLSATGFIQDLISAAIDVIFSPIEAIFEPLVDPLVDLIGLPDIGFSVSVSFDDNPQGMPFVCMCTALSSVSTTLPGSPNQIRNNGRGGQ